VGVNRTRSHHVHFSSFPIGLDGESMDTPFRIDVEELKERLQVFKMNIPEDEIINNFVAVEEGLKAEVNDLIQSIGVEDPACGHRLYPDQVPRIKARMLIRSMFATIEGIVYGMKQLAFAANRADGPLTLDELLICKEISFGQKGNGEVDGSSMRLKFESNVKFAFAVLAKVFHQSFELNTNCQAWNRLVQSVKVRNRLVHPKRSSDLELTDDELRHAIEAYQWFDLQVGVLLEMFGKNVEKSNNYLDAMLKAVMPHPKVDRQTRSRVNRNAKPDAAPDRRGT
jgi:hypothetical protein